MNKKKALLLSIIAIISLVVITVGVTVAFFNYSKQGSTENVIKSGGITFYYDEVDKNGNGINLVDALPMTDSEGKSQTNGFNFKVEGVGTENISIPYEITLRKKLGSDDIDNIVKVYLAKTTASNAAVNTEEEVITSLYSSLEDTTHNGYSEKVLYNGLVPATTSSYTQNYRLKLWIDNDTDYSPVVNSETGEDEYPYENKHFTVMVNVYANGRVLTEESKRANISSVGVNNTVLTKEEVNGIDTYETTLPEGTTSATINVETENPYSTVTIIKTQSDYETPIAMSNTEKIAVAKQVSLTNGNNHFKIVTTSEDNKVTKETHMLIKIQRSVVIFGDVFEVIDETPNFTEYFNSSTEQSGLYALDVENGYSNGVDGTTYYFRGRVENNYVDFAGKIWRIIRINEDGTIRLISEEAYGSYVQYDEGEQNIYYTDSKIKNVVESWYNSNIANNQLYISKIASGAYFCEASKVYYEDKYNGSFMPIGNEVMQSYLNYVPDFKCETDGNGKGTVISSVGLLNYDEIKTAGAGNSTAGKFYLWQNDRNVSIWTMSPAGYFKGTKYIWVTTMSSPLTYMFTTGNSGNFKYYKIRPVINLKSDVTATGTGTSSDPYVVQ